MPFAQTGTPTDIVGNLGGMGLIATIAGALAGDDFEQKIGINRSLWVFWRLQFWDNLTYFIPVPAWVKIISMRVLSPENFVLG